MVGLGRAFWVVCDRMVQKVYINALRARAGKCHTWAHVASRYCHRPLAWVAGRKNESLYIQPSPLGSYGGQVGWNNESLYIGSQIDGFPLWHQGYEDMAQTFYKDIVLRVGQGPQLAPDIKTPWEYSRFLWAPQLALAYRRTGDKFHKKRYQDLVMDWINANPYMLGINWLCPMEVAIRAINWIISYTLMAPELEQEVSKKIICCLYDHMIYLERNWELADGRTSNHYLSDLVGYLYLVWFFNDEKKQRWAHAAIEHEMAWQVFDEGTSYEGSTSYHHLVTELFVHADSMAHECGLIFSDQFYEKLNKMKEFIRWFGDIKIGDDDSGRITIFDLFAKDHDQHGIKTYPQFGLSIIKTSTWHISLRHPSYGERQPTGHFHRDAGSFTLAYNGIPIFIDPGSYVYTPSAYWRDHFRATQVHNKLYEKNDEKNKSNDDMFTLRLPESVWQGNAFEIDKKYVIETSYSVDISCLIESHKKVECDTLTNSILISDMITSNMKSDLYANLTAAPGIEFECVGDAWVVLHHDKPLLTMRSDFDYQPYQAWIAPHYGEKIKTVGLCAPVVHQNNTTSFAWVRE